MHTGRRDFLRILLLGAVLFLARLPFLPLGYGLDLDARRVVRAVEHIAETGEYMASRLPGYPVQEYAYALLPAKTPLAFNLVTSVLAFGALVLFCLLLRRFHCRDWILAAVAWSFVPVVFINGSNSMDYFWALAFLLGGFHLALEKKPLLAGLSVGLAIGCRLTSAAALLPFGLLVTLQDRERGRGLNFRAALLFVLAALLVAALAYAPVYARYGRNFLIFSDDRIALPYALKKSTLEVWGLLGSLALAASTVSFFLNRIRWKREGSIPAEVPPLHLVTWVLLVALFGAIFLRLPHEGAYFLPAIPFLFLVLAWGLPRRVFQILCGCLMASAFIVNLKAPELTVKEQMSPLAFSAHLGGRGVIVDPLYGPLIAEFIRRQMDDRRIPTYGTVPPREPPPD